MSKPALTVVLSDGIAAKLPIKVNATQNAYRGGQARSTKEPRKASGGQVQKRKRVQWVRWLNVLVAS